MLDSLGRFNPGEEAGGRTTDIRGCDEGPRVAEGGWGTEEEAGAALGGGLRTEEGVCTRDSGEEDGTRERRVIW